MGVGEVNEEFRKDAFTVYLSMSTAAPVLYKEIEKGPPPLKQFLSQLAKSKGHGQAGFRARDLMVLGEVPQMRGFEPCSGL